MTLTKIDPTSTASWKRLRTHYESMKDVHMRDLFREDPERFPKYSVRFEDILMDYSKNRIEATTLKLLLELADEVKLGEVIEAMFSGEAINETEHRAVLHTALRNRSNAPVLVDGEDVMPEVNGVLDRLLKDRGLAD